ncbi:MAG TPA: IS630 family transposase [Patescibacteria group bacterium]|nr:IS630 family transposase [Patescibacteria group bacterium]
MGKKIRYYKNKYPDYALFCEDESTFLYDSVSRKVWVLKDTEYRRYVTGSHQKVHAYGFFFENSKRMFTLRDNLNAKEFLNVLSKFLHKFKKVILMLDKAPWHKKSKKVQSYLKKHRREIKIIWFPTGCPEMNPVEECWRQAKEEVNGGRIHESLEVMKKELRHFLKYHDFKQDMRKYLRP